MKKIKTLHYCKADKKSGKPIVLTDVETNNRTNRKQWSRKLVDPRTGKSVIFRMKFNNASGRAKKQGATTVLEIWED